MAKYLGSGAITQFTPRSLPWVTGAMAQVHLTVTPWFSGSHNSNNPGCLGLLPPVHTTITTLAVWSHSPSSHHSHTPGYLWPPPQFTLQSHPWLSGAIIPLHTAVSPLYGAITAVTSLTFWSHPSTSHHSHTSDFLELSLRSTPQSHLWMKPPQSHL